MNAARNSRTLGVAIFAVLLTMCVAALANDDSAPPKPKIRAVTAFIRLDRARYKEQVEDALLFLRQAKSAFTKKGYEVDTIRITTQPFPEYTKDLTPDATIAFLRDFDALAAKENFAAAIGPAMTSDPSDPREADVLAKTLASTKILEGSIVIAGDDGIHWNSIRAAVGVIRHLEANTLHSQGNFNFAASALVSSGTPFYPASYFTGRGKEFAIGLESANVVASALASAKSPDEAEKVLAKSLGFHAQQIERIAQALASETSWAYGGIDLSPAPAPAKESSIGGAIESYLHAPVGSSGTLTTAAAITRSLREIPVKHAGYSGLMLPVLEDFVLAQRWSEGRLTMDSLLAYSAVCGTGLDTIPLPGDVTDDELTRILSDVASLSVKWHKPLSARLLPVAGKHAGDMTEFGDKFLVNVKLQPLP